MMKYAVGIDIGGTRIKLGIVDLSAGKVVEMRIFDTCRDGEEEFLQTIKNALENCLITQSIARTQLLGVGVSIGSYVFRDGTIDGMSCFVPFMVEGYPLISVLEKALELPVRADNDARLIALAESRYGAGKGYQRTLTITLGSGVGVGLCVDGEPFGEEAFYHLAGHIKVQDRGEQLDQPLCYCGISGCLEAACSGTAWEKYLQKSWGCEMTNQRFFEVAAAGEPKMIEILNQYLDYLSTGLNQYIYMYCPDIIILGGGIARGLEPWHNELAKRLSAKVHFRHQPILVISTLMEDGGVLGAASLVTAELL